MFTKELLKRNKKLIDFVIKKHKEGTVEPDTYFLDLDSIENNAKLLYEKSKELNQEIFQMSKQIGRNPLIAKAISKQGIDHVVAVDWKEAEILFKNGLKIGNIGHVVQVPKSKIKNILKMNPKYWTVYSLENLIQINKVAKELNTKQNILIRVYNDERYLYPSQKGGIHVNDIKKFVHKAQKLENIEIVGITSFPCLLIDTEKQKAIFTNNLKAIEEGIKILKDNNIKIEHVNLPSANSLLTLEDVKKMGGNGVEPGHAFTGTNPITEKIKHKEQISILYYSQVSHIFENKIIGFAGGHYRRSRMEGALIGNNLKFFKNIPINPEAIDYYFEFQNKKNSNIKYGNPIITSFRTQIFVTRSKVAIVKGLSKGKAKIVGIYDSQGNEIHE